MTLRIYIYPVCINKTMIQYLVKPGDFTTMQIVHPEEFDSIVHVGDARFMATVAPAFESKHKPVATLTKVAPPTATLNTQTEIKSIAASTEEMLADARTFNMELKHKLMQTHSLSEIENTVDAFIKVAAEAKRERTLYPMSELERERAATRALKRMIIADEAQAKPATHRVKNYDAQPAAEYGGMLLDARQRYGAEAVKREISENLNLAASYRAKYGMAAMTEADMHEVKFFTLQSILKDGVPGKQESLREKAERLFGANVVDDYLDRLIKKKAFDRREANQPSLTPDAVDKLKRTALEDLVASYIPVADAPADATQGSMRTAEERIATVKGPLYPLQGSVVTSEERIAGTDFYSQGVAVPASTLADVAARLEEQTRIESTAIEALNQAFHPTADTKATD